MRCATILWHRFWQHAVTALPAWRRMREGFTKVLLTVSEGATDKYEVQRGWVPQSPSAQSLSQREQGSR